MRDLTLAAARDARVDGSTASDARLTLNGRNITVAHQGLVQAADTFGRHRRRFNADRPTARWPTAMTRR
ncbi:hypothetical protein WJ970_02660 [Achromobacter xylosoxidans]